jgi:hypothetical protein
MSKPIPTSVHGVLDYIVALALLFAPDLFGFSDLGGAAEAVPRVLGAVILLQALVTDYEVGLWRALPMRTHLAIDYVLGIVLAISPWLFGFADAPDRAWLPHLIVGLAILIVAALTEPVPRRVRLGREPTVP